LQTTLQEPKRMNMTLNPPWLVPAFHLYS
jgi:hypothetical protein